MTCRQAFDIDLATFLAEPGAAAFERFRAHYPGCRDCASEVRAWTDVHLTLSGEQGARHPEPAALLAFDAEASPLPPAERRAIGTHLTACASCRDELAALHAAERAGLAQGAPARRPSEQRPGLLDRVRALVLHPAFAYAVVLLLLYPALRGVRDGEEARPVAAPAPVPQATRVPAPTPAAPPAPAAKAQSRRDVPREPAPTASPPDAQPRREAAREPAREAAPPAPAQDPAGYGVTAGARLLSEGRVQSAAPTVAGGPAELMALPPVDHATAGERVVLRVPVPAGAGGAVEVRVVSADGRREVRERIDRPAAAEAVVVEVAAAWLEPGSYAVEVRDPASADVPTAAYALTVR